MSNIVSGLLNGNWKFYSLHNVNRKNFRFTKWKLEIFWFMLHKWEKFRVYEMETGNFPVSIWSKIIPEFRFTQQIWGSFHFQNGNFFPEKWKPYIQLPFLLCNHFLHISLQFYYYLISRSGWPLLFAPNFAVSAVLHSEGFVSYSSLLGLLGILGYNDSSVSSFFWSPRLIYFHTSLSQVLAWLFFHGVI